MFSLSGTEITRRLASALSLRVPPQLLALWIAVPFVYYGLVLGATFWVDGFCYSGLASAFRDPALFREFNSGWGRISLGHLQPGVAVLCWGLEFLPTAWQWPTLTIIQRFLAFAVLLWVVLEITDYRPTVMDALICALLTWNPFYQSFHNALLTESLSSSLLLCLVAAMMRIQKRQRVELAIGVLSVSAMFIVTNIRSYFVVMALLLLLAGSFCLPNFKNLRLAAVASITAAFAVLIYPSVRYWKAGEWFLPGNNMVSLLAAGWSASHGYSKFPEVCSGLPQSAARHLEKLNDPDQVFDYKDAKMFSIALFDAGFRSDQVSKTFLRLARALNSENKQITEIRIRNALSACGFVLTSGVAAGELQISRRRTVPEYTKHQAAMYHYHAWMEGPKDYEAFFVLPREVFVASWQGQQWFRNTHANYIEPNVSVARVDPLRLGRIPFDVWAFLGLFGIAFTFFFRSFFVGWLLAIPLIVNFLVMFSVPLGSVRYAYCLLPIYILALMSSSQGNCAKSFRKANAS